MLYVNDELVKPGSPQFTRFKKFKEEVLPSFANPVVFKSGRPIRFNDNGLPEPLPASWIPLDHNLEGPDGGEHWRYCERPPRKIKDGNLKYNPRGMVMKKLWQWDKNRDAEKIFFFHEISPFVRDGRIVFQDKARDARETIAKETADLDTRWMITSDKSPISVAQTGSDDILRMMAAAWGVEDAHLESISTEEIQVALLSAVQESHKNYNSTGRGYAEFLEEVDAQNRVASMANVQKAIDTNVLIFDRPTFTWRFVKTNTPLATIPARDASDPKRALNKFLSINPKSARMLELALGSAYATDEEEEGEDLTIEKVESMNYGELRDVGKTLGIKAHGKKQKELLEEIINAIML